MKRWILVALASLGIGFWLGRQGEEEIREAFFPTTPREAYLHRLETAGLAETPLGARWVRAAEEALREAPRVSAPFRETGYLDAARPSAVAYRFPMRAGQRLELEAVLEPAPDALLFIELFRAPADSVEEAVHVASADSGETRISYEPRRDGDYILRLQPELLRGGRYTLTARARPTLGFPVAGGRLTDVQSVFGDARDGGARDHHGIDIFARRGTPVVAATDGRVTSVRNTPRGGNVVWLRDDRRGYSLYYAHLDRQLVEAGAVVRQGDTLGLVGNTGNARTTPPHLHFGIYRRGVGPLDPLPFVRPLPETPGEPVVALEDLGAWRRVAGGGAELRAGPDPGAAVLAQLDAHVPVEVLAATTRWYRVRAPDGRRGFIRGAATEAMRPLRTAALGADAPLRDSPGPGGAEIARLEAGERVEVLGGVADHLYVRARGQAAWIPEPGAP